VKKVTTEPSKAPIIIAIVCECSHEYSRHPKLWRSANAAKRQENLGQTYFQIVSLVEVLVGLLFTADAGKAEFSFCLLPPAPSFYAAREATLLCTQYLHFCGHEKISRLAKYTGWRGKLPCT
jgi:hypothetical protein